MKTKHLLILALTISFSIGCKTETETSTETDNTVEVTEEITDSEELSKEELDEDLEGLKLNLGEKWKVNPETEAGMLAIDLMVSDFAGDDYKSLGTNVKAELSSIIDQCTMKGEDHDQYHIILKAMMKESKKMKRGKSETKAKLERYLAAYYSHFEL